MASKMADDGVVVDGRDVDDDPLLTRFRRLAESQPVVDDWRGQGTVHAPGEGEGVVGPLGGEVKHRWIRKAWK